MGFAMLRIAFACVAAQSLFAATIHATPFPDAAPWPDAQQEEQSTADAILQQVPARTGNTVDDEDAESPLQTAIEGSGSGSGRLPRQALGSDDEDYAQESGQASGETPQEQIRKRRQPNPFGLRRPAGPLAAADPAGARSPAGGGRSATPAAAGLPGELTSSIDAAGQNVPVLVLDDGNSNNGNKKKKNGGGRDGIVPQTRRTNLSKDDDDGGDGGDDGNSSSGETAAVRPAAPAVAPRRRNRKSRRHAYAAPAPVPAVREDYDEIIVGDVLGAPDERQENNDVVIVTSNNRAGDDDGTQQDVIVENPFGETLVEIR